MVKENLGVLSGYGLDLATSSGVYAAEPINQFSNVLTSGQQFIGTLPQEQPASGIGARKGTRSSSFRGREATGQGGGQQQASGSGFETGIVYQIHVLGEVVAPGTYRVSASTRLAEAVKLAGDILSRGSQRRVEVRHTGSPTRVYDLYRFLYAGSLADNPYLMDNDMVYVPLNKGLIEITGGIQRPDQYEVTREKSLYDIIKLAGGYTKGALMTEPIKVIRYGDGTKEVIDVGNRPEDLKNFEIKTGRSEEHTSELH